MSILKLVVTLADMALSDPLTTVSSLLGNVFTLFAVGMFVYVALGALGAELGIIGAGPSSGRPP